MLLLKLIKRELAKLLNKEHMTVVTKDHNVIFTYDRKELHNMQTIQEKLIRAAVKYCDQYCTDMLILINSLPEAFLQNEENEIDIWIRAMGVEWEYGSGRKVGGKPKLYRREMKLYLDEKGMLTLYENCGNC